MNCKTLSGAVTTWAVLVQQAYMRGGKDSFGQHHPARSSPIMELCLELRGMFTEYSGFSEGMP